MLFLQLPLALLMGYDSIFVRTKEAIKSALAIPLECNLFVEYV